MRFSLLSDEEILKELAHRIDQRRREKEISDADLVEKSGTNIATLKRFRANKGTISLTSFIRILRGLEELDALNALLESTQTFSPAQQLEKPLKKRIYKKKSKPSNFQWGDE
ncbi:MAG: transcriptional regulator, XRE family protein [Epsilonproteobacteria bacterium]|jgi:transcriptional regulator with XRE-family HTH domain|nr:transcriptional regulator, XRE family protein [Campylobacterota bacterium]